MRIILIASLLLSFSFACKKKTPAPVTTNLENGFGTSDAKWHALLEIEANRITGLSTDIFFANSVFSSETYGYAALKHPDLSQKGMGLSVQQVAACGTSLDFVAAANDAVLYNKDINIQANALPSWKVVGGSNFSSFETQLYRNFPSISTAQFFPSQMSSSSDFTLSISTLVSNADSVLLSISDNANVRIQKRLPATTSTALVKATELQQLSHGYYAIELVAVNYANQICSGKSILYELRQSVQSSFVLQ